MSEDYDEEFERIRNKALEEAPEEGRDILRDSSSSMAFASDTSAFGISYRDELLDLAIAEEDKIKEKAARFVGYEATEQARKSGLYMLMDGEETLEALHSEGKADVEDVYRAMILVDRLQSGFADKRPEEEFNGDNEINAKRYPNYLMPDTVRKDQIAAAEESKNVHPDNIGNLFQVEAFVIDDDWLSYRNGERPPSIEGEKGWEVYDFLHEMGVGR